MKRSLITTAQLAKLLSMKAASIRSALWRNEWKSFQGLTPVKLPNGRIRFRVHEVEKLIGHEIDCEFKQKSDRRETA